jgi:hypothetical protein
MDAHTYSEGRLPLMTAQNPRIQQWPTPSACLDGRGSGRQQRPSRHADGHGRCGHGAFRKFLKFDPAQPRWPDRDRFILSAGHGSMLIYSLLHLTGYEQPTMDDISKFRQLHSVCAGHPENTELPGVECTTGPLGQGWPCRWALRWPSVI